MKFAQRSFLVAGVYGLLALLPLYFLEQKFGHDHPPAITHPEFFYGFVGVGLAWQALFLLIARDPVRYRLVMLPAVLEKAGFGFAVIVLYLQQRVHAAMMGAAGIDLILGALFLIAYRKTREANT